ncbi:MAG: hypothetical protein PHV75_05130 [Victivallaceae bacterium]|nr:hypothetical protein [Victivallaceae bacterium]MDD3703365.1 hypothetical protein [Victivallaceae bacterium]MDD4317882.1 hypothetical protein [Victivallaceae bacterium]MDD5663633.1 hypothetical protein [Victivallaceae bacterium]NLK83774.1 hypothetical protein [Lentisphaerota bacterium]
MIVKQPRFKTQVRFVIERLTNIDELERVEQVIEFDRTSFHVQYPNIFYDMLLFMERQYAVTKYSQNSRYYSVVIYDLEMIQQYKSFPDIDKQLPSFKSLFKLCKKTDSILSI